MFSGLVPNRQSLSSPGSSDPKRILGNEREYINNRLVLPAKTSTQAVLKESEKAAKAKKHALLLQMHSRQQLATMRSALQAYTTRLSHSQQAMAAVNQYQQTGVRHREAMFKYDLNTGVNERQIEPWDEAVGSANDLFNF